MRQFILFVMFAAIFQQVCSQNTASGVFGAVTDQVNSANKWIKFGEITLNGNYTSAGMFINFFPKNPNHGDSHQEITIMFRNDNLSGIQSSYDLTLITYSGVQRSIKDVQVIHTSGTGVTDNKLSVWIQMGVSWLANVSFDIRYYGNVSFATTNQPFHSTIPETGTVYQKTTTYGMIGSTYHVNGVLRADELKADSKLTVQGLIHAQEVKVDLNVPGPDYVFEKDYPLLPLEETKAYIDQHKHLPGIPSSADMQQNGVNLLEMNMKLLEKVEELTLHLIEQH